MVIFCPLGSMSVGPLVGFFRGCCSDLFFGLGFSFFLPPCCWWLWKTCLFFFLQAGASKARISEHRRDFRGVFVFNTVLVDATVAKVVGEAWDRRAQCSA